MRILHTSDWHLGKTLEGYSRLEEQAMFLEELISIVEKKSVDLLLIAGDIYDTVNPPALAEKLFYDTITRISDNGKRGVLVIAGNHDNPDRIEAVSPLACSHGVILLGRPKSQALVGKYGNIDIIEAGEGYARIKVNDEEAVIVTLPYPSEKRLNEILSNALDDEERRKSYGQRVGELFRNVSSHFRDDTVNLAVSHLYLAGGEESQSERPIQLGGSFSVEVGELPDAQYIALGHLHKSQIAAGGKKQIRYSGSPLQYSKSEIHNSNCVYVVDVVAGRDAEIEQVFLKNHKPIENWKCKGIQEALQKCQENSGRNLWVYMEIETDRGITQDEIKQMKDLVKDIVQIQPCFPNENDSTGDELTDYRELKMDELFKAYYRNEYGAEIPQDLMDLFYEIVGEGEDEDNEAQIAQN